jgi:VIT1/CCC1 family predicted Fe2+/Mn2+ transporter
MLMASVIYARRMRVATALLPASWLAATRAWGMRQYLRDIILGVNDGLVSMLLLMVAMAGGGVTPERALFIGVTGALAGSASMGLAEYLATKSQAGAYAALSAQVQCQLRENPIAYQNVIKEHFTDTYGFGEEDAIAATQWLEVEPMNAAKFLCTVEFGIVEPEQRRPSTAMLFSSALFLVGSLTSVVPFGITSDMQTATTAAVVGCGIGLFLIGGVKTVATAQNWILGALENLFFGAAGAGISWYIGTLNPDDSGAS